MNIASSHLFMKLKAVAQAGYVTFYNGYFVSLSPLYVRR